MRVGVATRSEPPYRARSPRVEEPPLTRPAACLVLPLLSACLTEAECERRASAAFRVGHGHALDCAFEPEALLEPVCTRFDRRPLQSYYAAYCGTAELSCIRAEARAEAACFGDPNDTDPVEYP